MMNKETLKKYAEAGVRERLREIQHELDDLARDFPHLVQNADGSHPSVLPLELKPKKGRSSSNGNGNGHGGRYAAIVAILKAHPNSTTKQIAKRAGIGRAGVQLHLNAGLKRRELARTHAPSTSGGPTWSVA